MLFKLNSNTSNNKCVPILFKTCNPNLLIISLGVYLAEELISPLLTPFILYFNVRHKALDFVDFLRNYTVNVVGMGCNVLATSVSFFESV